MANNGCFGSFTCARYVLIAINVIYIAVAITLIAVATGAGVVEFIVDYSVMGGIIACGVLLLIIALVGLVGTALHHQATLFFYMIILSMLFVMQFIIACACLAVGPARQQQLFEAMWHDTPGLRAPMQQRYNCCGCIDAERDDMNGTQELHPRCNDTSACCANSNASCCTGLPVDPGMLGSTPKCPCDSCWTNVENLVDDTIKAAGGVGLFFSFTEVLGVWMAYRFRNLKDPRADPNQFL